MQLLSFPFALTGSGAVATVEDGTEEALSQALAVLVCTRKGERPSAPAFGITDPTFDELDVAEVNAALDAFGPEIRVTALRSTPRTDLIEDAELEWEYADAGT